MNLPFFRVFGTGLSLLTLLLATAACTSEPGPDATPKERYVYALKQGLKSSEVTTKTFLDLELGMPLQAFYDSCTALNGRELITMGRAGNAVNHRMTEEFSSRAELTFVPDVSDDRTIQAFDVLYHFEGWSPWNKRVHSDVLLAELKTYYEEQYGPGWITLEHPTLGEMIVQVKNNRRIALWKKDAEMVQGRFTDLRALPDETLGKK